jgi:hypothetical protein
LGDNSAVKNEAWNSPTNKDEGRLDGWEEIASFLGRGIRTVRRWEKEAGLPVRRLFKQRRSLVHAYRNELAHWVKGREEHASLPSNLTSESKSDGDPSLRAPRDVLTGWKEVAALVGRSVRTVQRWEREMGLPVRRLKSCTRSIPYALRSELTAWLKECGIPPNSTGEGGSGLHLPHLLQVMIDGWNACIAVLNETGTIVAVNRAWKETAQATASCDPDCGVGKNYVNLCISLSRAKAGPTPAATERVAELLRGERQSLQIRYRANNSTEKRWFLLQSARFNFHGEVCLVLIHSDITEPLGD